MVSILAVAAACTGSGDDVAAPTSTTAPVPIGEPGLDEAPFAPSYGSAAGDGDDLIVLSTLSGPARNATALRRSDGTWWRLPSLPFGGYVQLAPAGDRAVAGGIACVDDDCDAGELAFAILAEDRSEWIRLDAPEVELSVQETELTTSPGPGPFAEFQVGAEQYSVDDRGELVDWLPEPVPDRRDGFEVGCNVGDSYVSTVSVRGQLDADPGPAFPGDVYVQTVGGDAEPESLGAVPVPTDPLYVCAAGRVSFGGAGTQAVLDVDAGTWTTGPTNLVEMRAFMSPISGRLASSPDGSTAFMQSTVHGIIRRVGDGLWEPTGVDGHVFSTGDQVLVIGDDQQVSEVWPG